MQQKMTFAGVAALVVAAAMATPSYATVRHRVAHQSSQSTPAERQQTAELNRQQLTQAQESNTGGGTTVGSTATGAATQQNGLTTEPTNYRRPGSSSSGMTGTGSSGTGSMGSQPGADTGAMQTPNSAPPIDAVPESSPGGTTTPPPTNPSDGTQ